MRKHIPCPEKLRIYLNNEWFLWGLSQVDNAVFWWENNVKDSRKASHYRQIQLIILNCLPNTFLHSCYLEPWTRSPTESSTHMVIRSSSRLTKAYLTGDSPEAWYHLFLQDLSSAVHWEHGNRGPLRYVLAQKSFVIVVLLGGGFCI